MLSGRFQADLVLSTALTEEDEEIFKMKVGAEHHEQTAECLNLVVS